MDQKFEPRLQRKLEQSVTNSTMKQNMELMMTLSNTCFAQCVHKFPSKTCSKEESACIEHCADRYVVLSQRVGKKYQEYQHKVVKKMALEKEKGEGNI